MTEENELFPNHSGYQHPLALRPAETRPDSPLEAPTEEAPDGPSAAPARSPATRSARSRRRARQALKKVQDQWLSTQKSAATEYERELSALYKPAGVLEAALVRNLARSLARYEAMESLESALQTGFWRLSLSSPQTVLFDPDAWQQYARNAPRLRKPLQSELLKLIHEIERLQSGGEDKKPQPVRIIDHNTG